MAIWQYDLQLVFKEKLVSFFNEIPKNIDEDKYESIEWFENISLPPDFDSRVSQILPPSESWSDDIKQYGKDTGDCISLVYENDLIVEILIRIDIRNISLRFIEKLVDLALYCNSFFLTSTFLILAPNISNILDDINNSASAAFLKDPKKFLNDLTDKEQKSI